MTLGGTSLSAPVVAAMWALAGGAQNVDYPALTLYGHLQSAPATYDVRTGGNGACGSLSPTGCRSFYGTNPNDFWQANVDCGFRPNDTVNVGQCYARPGYDGPSGVGAPKGLKTFRALAPTVSLSAPASAAVGDSVPVTGSATDPFPGGTVSGYSWTFGDGATAVGASSEHVYSSPGTYTVTLTVTDSYGVTGAASQTVTVS
jgi:PKD repeat protein